LNQVEGGEHLGRYSFVGCNPRAVIRQTLEKVEVIENGRILESYVVSRTPGPNAERWSRVVERVMKKYRAVALPGLPRFTGGRWVLLAMNYS